MDAADRLINARCRLMIREPFYGHMAMGMIWKSSSMSWLPEEKRRLGIKITGDGIKVYFYPKWVDSRTLEQLFGAVQHIMNHLVALHTIRRSGRRLDIWDRATDMAANGSQNDPRVAYREEGHKLILPYDDLMWIPDKWPDDESAEYYYDRIMKEDPPKPDEERDQSCDGPGNRPYESIDDHDMWSQTDVSVDEARQMIFERAKDASEKSVGNIPGHLKQALEDLKRPIVSWRELTRQYLGNHVGNRRWTYSRTNRRSDAFGIKGISHHACAEMVVVVDTSGSISSEELQQFFSEIESMSSKCKVWVLMWDSAFNGLIRYRRGDWKKIKVSGGGGTDMGAPITYLEENNMIKDVVVMLTDGEVGGQWPSRRSFPMLFCITSAVTDLPDWGQVIRIEIN